MFECFKRKKPEHKAFSELKAAHARETKQRHAYTKASEKKRLKNDRDDGDDLLTAVLVGAALGMPNSSSSKAEDSGSDFKLPDFSSLGGGGSFGGGGSSDDF